MHLNKDYTKPTCLGYIICKIEDYFGVMEMYFSGKSKCKHVFVFFFLENS